MAVTNMMIGKKYYTVNEKDEIVYARIKKIKNVEKVQLEFEDGSLMTVSTKHLEEHFRLLTPDALVFVSIVTVGSGSTIGNDIIITLGDSNNMAKVDQNLPFAVCRQNIVDEFYKIVSGIMKQHNVIKLGISINQLSNSGHESVFKNFLQCTSHVKTEAVNIYINDSVDTIVHFLQSDRFNEVLQENYKINNASNFIGLCNSVKELLDDNNFQDDIDLLFGIFNIDTPIRKDGFLSPDQYEQVFKEFSLRFPGTPFSTIVNEPFSHEMDLSTAKRVFMFLKDSIGKLYVVSYI